MRQILYYYRNSKGKKHPLTAALFSTVKWKQTFLKPMNIPTSLYSQEPIPIPRSAKEERTATDQLFSKILNTQGPLHWIFFFKVSWLLSSSCTEGTGLFSSSHGSTVPLQGKGQSPSTRWIYGAQKPKFQPYSLTDNIPTKYYGSCQLLLVCRKERGMASTLAAALTQGSAITAVHPSLSIS